MKFQLSSPLLVLDHGLKLVRADPEVVTLLKVLNTHINPAFEAASKFSAFPVRGIPQFLSHFVESPEEGWIRFYRGARLEALPPASRDYLLGLPRLDRRIRAEAVLKPVPKLTPNPEQAVLLQRFDEARATNERPFGNYLFTASTSVGKTILALLAAARLNRRTLILCPTEQILLGWYDDLKLLYGMGVKDVGIIKRDRFVIGDYFTLASPKTLIRREDRWPEINSLFGTLVVDEAHNVSAPYLHDFVRQSPAEHLLGITATDSNVPALRALFGPSVADINTYGIVSGNAMNVTKLTVIRTEFRYEAEVSDMIDPHDLLMSMIDDEERNKLIVTNVVKDWLEGRVVLVATRSLEHLELLKDMLLQAGIENLNVITGTTNQDKLYTRSLRKMIGDRRVTCLLASVAAFKEGSNIPALDTLHLVTPIGKANNLEQLIGRIRRKASGKTDACLTFYLDHRVRHLQFKYLNVFIPTARKLGIPL